MPSTLAAPTAHAILQHSANERPRSSPERKPPEYVIVIIIITIIIIIIIMIIIIINNTDQVSASR